MALIQVWAWKCEAVLCGHEWLAADVEEPPTWCAKCRSRKWHKGSGAEVNGAAKTVDERTVLAHAVPASSPENSKNFSKNRRRGGIPGVPEMPRGEIQPLAQAEAAGVYARPGHPENCRCYVCKPPKG